MELVLLHWFWERVPESCKTPRKLVLLHGFWERVPKFVAA